MKKAQTKKAVKGHEVSTKEMLGKVVALVLTRPRLGIYKTVSSSNVKVDADQNWVGVKKRLFNSDTFREIDRVRTEARVYVAGRSLPSLLKRGVYLIPKESVATINTRLTELQKELDKLVVKFLGEWDELVKDAKKPLGSLFNASDYPAKLAVARRFQMTWRYVSFDVPVSLEQVSRDVYNQERKKAEESWSEARSVWQQLLRTEFSELVTHMVERLTPAKDGKKKIFRDTAVTNMTEWAEAFEPRNIQNDVQLKALVTKAKALLKGADPATLREDENARNQVRASFETIKNTLAKMVVDKPSRDVSFDED